MNLTSSHSSFSEKSCFFLERGSNDLRGWGSFHHLVPSVFVLPSIPAEKQPILAVASTCDTNYALTAGGTVIRWNPPDKYTPDPENELYPCASEMPIFQHKPEPGAETNTLPSPERLVSICSGSIHVMALTETGKIVSWGNNSKGQLGRKVRLPGEKAFDAEAAYGCATYAPDYSEIRHLPQGDKVRSLACGVSTSYALCESGDVYCCGSNIYHQMWLGGELSKRSDINEILSRGAHNNTRGPTICGLPWSPSSLTKLLKSKPCDGCGLWTRDFPYLPVFSKIPISDVTKVVCGPTFTLVSKSDGSLHIWGQIPLCNGDYERFTDMWEAYKARKEAHRLYSSIVGPKRETVRSLYSSITGTNLPTVDIINIHDDFYSKTCCICAEKSIWTSLSIREPIPFYRNTPDDDDDNDSGSAPLRDFACGAQQVILLFRDGTVKIAEFALPIEIKAGSQPVEPRFLTLDFSISREIYLKEEEGPTTMTTISAHDSKCYEDPVCHISAIGEAVLMITVSGRMLGVCRHVSPRRSLSIDCNLIPQDYLYLRSIMRMLISNSIVIENGIVRILKHSKGKESYMDGIITDMDGIITDNGAVVLTGSGIPVLPIWPYRRFRAPISYLLEESTKGISLQLLLQVVSRRSKRCREERTCQRYTYSSSVNKS